LGFFEGGSICSKHLAISYKVEADILENNIKNLIKSFTTPDFWQAYNDLSPEPK
jgi:hypothetical protein